MVLARHRLRRRAVASKLLSAGSPSQTTDGEVEGQIEWNISREYAPLLSRVNMVLIWFRAAMSEPPLWIPSLKLQESWIIYSSKDVIFMSLEDEGL